MAGVWEDLGGRGISTLLGLTTGAAITWMLARWKRHRDRQSILRGDARDTVVIHQHVIDRITRSDPANPGQTLAAPGTLRVRALGQSEVCRVIPNCHLASVFADRAHATTARDTLISMAGAEGSYLLETLTGFVCDRVGNEPFEHDLYVMAPCCEPADLTFHQPVTVLLISVADLTLFESWPVCRDVKVEHGGDGSRVLTLMELAKRFRMEQDHIASLRTAGKRARHEETMYVLDLALDKRTAPIPTKTVPWGRYEAVLKELGLE